MQEVKKGILTGLNYTDALIVTSIAIIAMLIRTLSAQYTLTINGFDSWYLFYNSVLISHAGGNWYAVPPDVHGWYPYGYFIELGDTIGLPFLVSLLSLPFYSTFGANANYTVTIFLDIALAGFSVLAAYLVVSKLINRFGGYIAAILIAVSPALTGKNIIGGLPKTSWGGMFILLSIFLLYKAIEDKKPILGIPTGFLIFLADITWGGNIYIDLTLGAAALLLVFLNRNDEITAKTFAITAITSALITSFAPNSIGFMSGLAHGLSLILISAILYIDIYTRKMLPADIQEARPILITAIAVAILGLGIAGLFSIGKTNFIPSRYFAIINPFYQVTVPIDKTVAEYIPQPVTSLLGEFGSALLLFIPGIYVLIQKGKLAQLWLAALGVIALYGTSAQPYLFNYTAYMVAAVAGIGAGFIISKLSSITGIENKLKITGIAIFMALILASIASDGAIAIAESNTPNAIITAASPYSIPNYAWVDALNWINHETPTNSVIFSWWDYGYWIEVIGNRTVIDENNTLNGTQIKLMAEMFLNNESFAAHVLENYYHLYPYGNPNYTRPVYFVAYDAITVYNRSGLTVAFLGYPTDIGGTFIGLTTSFGDINKAIGAMSIIAGYPQNEFINTSIVNETSSEIDAIYNQSPTEAVQLANLLSSSYTFAWTSRAYNSLIINLFVQAVQSQGYQVVEPFTYGYFSTTGGSPAFFPPVNLEYFQPVHISEYPWIPGPDYTTYIVVVIYQFVQPGVLLAS
ncbi:peptide transporter [Sulfolobales archaeon HS-7]|nr:peptide transporter [Sulfolobales archaeon HS-7]